MKLMREVRCFPDSDGRADPKLNTWGGSPDGERLGAYWVVRGTVAGPVHKDTGYVCNIVKIERVLRDLVVPRIRQRIGPNSYRAATVASAMLEIFPPASERFTDPLSLCSIELLLCPYLRFLVKREESAVIHVTQSFEFSASHRLYCATMSEEENRRVFGKCANANGHGHNYVVEVTLREAPDPGAGTVVDLARAQQVVKEYVIDRFDHKHLNLDCDEFASTNPSVENIACVIWNLLFGRFEPAQLASVRVWETPKTYAEYSGTP